MSSSPGTYLRTVSEDDIDAVMKWENDPELWKYSSGEGPFTKDEVLQFIRDCKDLDQHGQCRYIILDSNDVGIGAVDLFEFDPVNRTAGIGILVAEESDRKKKHATHAIHALVSDPEIKKRLRMLWCLVHEDNHASRRLFERCGFMINGKRLFKGREALRYILYL